MERHNFHVNDDELEALLRTRLAAAPLHADDFTRGVLAQTPPRASAEKIAAATNEARSSMARRGWFVAGGAAVGAALFAVTLRGLDLMSVAHQVETSARQVSDEIGDAAVTASNSVWPVSLALAATLVAVGFVFWSALRRWAARQWEQLA